MDRYDSDPIARFANDRRRRSKRSVELRAGLILEHTLTEFVGEVVRLRSGGIVELRDFDGFTRGFSITDAFLDDGEPVELAPPRQHAPQVTTASGSVASPRSRARVARASRIFVEGTHDAELIEQVWGDDLRAEGVAVEVLGGVDDLTATLRAFEPSSDRRAGILVDHLVTGSKESRIAAEVTDEFAPHVLVLGHPFVDVWQAVRPARLGITRWPAPPRSVEWKRGVCKALGWPYSEQADIADAWRRILATVRDYRDLEPSFSGQVEHLIDFVTVGHH